MGALHGQMFFSIVFFDNFIMKVSKIQVMDL